MNRAKMTRSDRAPRREWLPFLSAVAGSQGTAWLLLAVTMITPAPALADPNLEGRLLPAARTRFPTPEEFNQHRDTLGWCTYPLPRPRGKALNKNLRAQTLELDEIEPNDEIEQAQILSLSSEIGNEVDFKVSGSVSPGDDLDYYRISAKQGDIIGVSVGSEDVEEFLYSYTIFFVFYFFSMDVPVGVLDPVVGIYDETGELYHENDDDGGAGYYYPESSPLPVVELLTDSSLSFVVPEDGDYLIRVSSFVSASQGRYIMNVVMRRPTIEADGIGESQILYIDFDGVPFINVHAIWDDGWYATSFPPLRDFLFRWGLELEDEAAVVQAILDVVEQNFDYLRQPGLNGDRDAELIDGHYDIEIRNSRDHPDPWGEPNVSRVIVGGYVEDLGFGTIGIAQSIDPGNFDREETAVVLLGDLSAPPMRPIYCLDDQGNDDPSDDREVPCCEDPETGAPVACCIPDDQETCEDPEDPVIPILEPDPVTINGVPRAPGVGIIDVIGEIVGNIVTHEAGHYFGSWHTEWLNEQPCMMDKTFYTIGEFGGVGPDGIFGTEDDVDIDFVPDDFVCQELFFPAGKPIRSIIAECLYDGIELVDVRTAFGLSTGKAAISPPDPELPPTPSASVRATPTAGAAPLIVSFAGGGVDPNGDPFVTFNWNFGDGTSGTGANIDHVYTTPGTYMATLTSVSSGGLTSTATIRIQVLDVPNEPPAVMIAATPSTGEAPLIVVFEAAARDPDGVVVAYLWDFGDGTTASGQMVEHVFVDPGAYGVVLTGIDDKGGRGIATTIIRTSAPSGTTAAEIVGPDNSANQTPLPPADSLSLPACGAGVANGIVMSLLALMLIRRRL